MNKDKIINKIKLFNIIVLFIFFPIMIISFLFSLNSFSNEGFFNTLTIAVSGYFLALIFGILAFKKNYFLIFSVIGWLIFGVGNTFDAKKAMEGNNNACIELRQDKNCIEDNRGTLECKSGKFSGIYPGICKGLK
jgi:hypothetical protein